MKLTSLKALASAVAVTFAIGAPTQVSATHAWGNYHWARSANPFTLKLGDNVTGVPWNGVLEATSSDWSQSGVLDTAIVPGNTTAKRCRATAGMVQVCNSTYGNNGWLGIATIWASGSHITQGTTKLNDTYFNKPEYNSPAWRNLVMCQEVGHTFGLGHQDEAFDNPNLGTCMDYTSDPGTNQRPNDHDFKMLESIYSHLDSSTTVAPLAASAAVMPRHIAEHDSDDRAQWGALVRSSKDGLREVYMVDFGQGYRIFRFVIWAEGEGRGRRHQD
jgi:hypothetical protein